MTGLAAEAPMRIYVAGELTYTPHAPADALFILKEGQVRVFGSRWMVGALTTAIVSPGTIFGEMALPGHQRHGNFAEALEQAVVCVMSQETVRRVLLGDPRIAARNAEILGRRLTEVDRRLSDSTLKSVPQRVASTLVTFATEQGRRFGRSTPVVALTYEQLAALGGTSRETTTKTLGDFAYRGLIKLGRGRITVLDRTRLDAEAGG